jgi:hypothetical protein
MLNKIKKDNILVLNDVKYRVKSKVCYFTENNPNEYYYKIKCDNDLILVISEDLSDIFVGRVIDVEDIIAFPSPQEIKYNNESFRLITADYQFVKCIDFGLYGNYETECRFMDYQNINNSKLLSIGIDTFSGKRDDVYLERITINDIKIMN